MKQVDFKAEWGIHEKVSTKITKDQWDRIWEIIHEGNEEPIVFGDTHVCGKCSRVHFNCICEKE